MVAHNRRKEALSSPATPERVVRLHRQGPEVHMAVDETQGSSS